MPKKSLQARCRVAAGDNPAAILLLMRVCYWMPKAKVLRDGHVWVAKRREEWCEESGITLGQYRAAIYRLRDRGLVVAEQHMFGNKSITFIRLTDEAKSLLDSTPGRAHLSSPRQVHLNTPHIHGDTTLDTTSILLKENAGQADSDKKIPYGKEEEKTMGTVKDVLMKTGTAPTKVGKGNTPARLQHVWRIVVPEVYGVYVPPFTMKQTGQLKHFAKACPEGKAEDVLEQVLRDWPGFVAGVKAATGAKQVPSQPNVDFLLKHVGVAVTVALEILAPKPKEVVVPAKKPETPVQLIATEPVDEKASLEEIMSILHEDE